MADTFSTYDELVNELTEAKNDAEKQEILDANGLSLVNDNKQLIALIKLCNSPATAPVLQAKLITLLTTSAEDKIKQIVPNRDALQDLLTAVADNESAFNTVINWFVNLDDAVFRNYLSALSDFKILYQNFDASNLKNKLIETLKVFSKEKLNIIIKDRWDSKNLFKELKDNSEAMQELFNILQDYDNEKFKIFVPNETVLEDLKEVLGEGSALAKELQEIYDDKVKGIKKVAEVKEETKEETKEEEKKEEAEKKEEKTDEKEKPDEKLVEYKTYADLKAALANAKATPEKQREILEANGLKLIASHDDLIVLAELLKAADGNIPEAIKATLIKLLIDCEVSVFEKIVKNTNQFQIFLLQFQLTFSNVLGLFSGLNEEKFKCCIKNKTDFKNFFMPATEKSKIATINYMVSEDFSFEKFHLCIENADGFAELVKAANSSSEVQKALIGFLEHCSEEKFKLILPDDTSFEKLKAVLSDDSKLREKLEKIYQSYYTLGLSNLFDERGSVNTDMPDRVEELPQDNQKKTPNSDSSELNKNNPLPKPAIDNALSSVSFTSGDGYTRIKTFWEGDAGRKVIVHDSNSYSLVAPNYKLNVNNNKINFADNFTEEAIRAAAMIMRAAHGNGPNVTITYKIHDANPTQENLIRRIFSGEMGFKESQGVVNKSDFFPPKPKPLVPSEDTEGPPILEPPGK